MKEVKAIVFDIGGVLLINEEEYKKRKISQKHLGVHQEVARQLKISVDQWFDAIDTPYALSMQGKISENKVVKTISKNLQISTKRLEKVYLNAFKKHFNKNKELYDFALKLKKQGYKIAILSDQWHLSKKACPKIFYKTFNPVVLSCDVGIRKPDPKIFKLILKKLKVRPHEAVFIDNQKWNIGAAKKLGIQTILFRDNKQVFKQLKKFGIK